MSGIAEKLVELQRYSKGCAGGAAAAPGYHPPPMVTEADDLDDAVRGLLSLPQEEAVAEVLRAAGGDRERIVASRDRFATALRGRTDDFEATGALTLLNRVLAEHGPHDPLDWKLRWARGRKP